MRVIDLPIEELELSEELKTEGFRVVGVVKTSTNTHVVVVERTLASLDIAVTRIKTYFVSADGWDGGQHGSQILRPKKRKKVFIKTLKELVDSGWDVKTRGCTTYLAHPDAETTTFNIEMLKHCGEERATVGQACAQNKWHWTPEMLIEKEV